MDYMLGREVFIVADGEEEEPGDILFTESQAELSEGLLHLSIDVDTETRVFHGVLALAEYLPPSFKGKTAFIVYLKDELAGKGGVIEGGDTPEELAKDIEGIIKTSKKMMKEPITIDNLYILYGYQLELGLAINEEDIDEEVIFTCLQIADDTEEVGETARETEV